MVVFMSGAFNQLEVVGAGVLRIESVQLSDSGVYICVLNATSSSTDHWDLAYLNLTVTGMCTLGATFYTRWLPFRPGKHGKVREFDIGQGKVREIVVCLFCAITIQIVTK